MSNLSRGDKISALSGGLNLANLAISSGVLDQSWDAITETKNLLQDQPSVSGLTLLLVEKGLPKYNIIVFVTPPITRSVPSEKTELETFSKPTISDFDFLHSKRKKSSFSINKDALSLFGSRKKELLNLVDRIAKEANPKPYIITGDGIGGSVASLFALQLFSSLDTKKTKLPLCITFGSPLLGDSGLQKAISDYKTWNSCFLHVVSMDDCLPSLFVQPNHQVGGQTMGHASTYHPFGRFMFCSNSGGACFGDPESALTLQKKTGAESGQYKESFDYGSIIANLRKGFIYKAKINLNANGKASVAAQYLAGLLQLQDVGRNSQLEVLLNRLGKLLEDEMLVLEQKRKELEKEAEDLNNIKVYMTYMEWYKKTSEKNEVPYYDRYKNQVDRADINLHKFKGNLQKYWADRVQEADQKPQKAGAALRVRWLFAGTTYRRMVEPLEIADYYKREGARDYINQRRTEGGLKHYELLEEWFKDDLARAKSKRQNVVPPSLTEDSCFWAHVEEAIISCKILNKRESASDEIDNLKKFEEYVLERIRKYEVSSDIFWEEGSFMKWWKDYVKILDKGLMGTYSSPLSGIMRNDEYKKYIAK